MTLNFLRPYQRVSQSLLGFIVKPCESRVNHNTLDLISFHKIFLNLEIVCHLEKLEKKEFYFQTQEVLVPLTILSLASLS